MPEEEPETPEQESCGFFDYACKVRQAFNGWLAGVVAELINMQLLSVAVATLATPLPYPGVEDSWGTSLAVANSLYVLAVTAGGVLVMTNPTVQTSVSVKELLPRLLLGFVAANISWFLCGVAARLANAVVLALLGQAATPETAADTIARMLSNPVGELVVMIILLLVASLLVVFFSLAGLIRIMLWLGLIVAAPLALACHVLPQTEGVARLWWRAVGALLLIPIAQALVLRLAVDLLLGREEMLGLLDMGDMAGSLLDVLLVICCMYILVRIPFWVFKRVFNYQASPLLRIAKFAVQMLVFRSIGKALAAGRAGRAVQKTAAVRPPRRAPAPAPTVPRPQESAAPRRPRWQQPELPLEFPKPKPPAPEQRPLPGIDRGIDPAEQKRAAQRRRWVQPPLPGGALGRRSRPPWSRQDPIPGLRIPRWRQEPIPGVRTPPQAKQGVLFEATPQMRRPARRSSSGPGSVPRPPSPDQRRKPMPDPRQPRQRPTRPQPEPRFPRPPGVPKPIPYSRQPDSRSVRPRPRPRPSGEQPRRRRRQE
ncbi:hypothetical protein [Nocardiopsis composta]|uniref:Uncharacterized protein n=1 Tax=Nocardiopsis composta TaxID=157465 RepID=A0A7W8QHZ4_9ACTN|nr:hypothetical protein [Nocardiopsis composta]MBB5429951.1 hypothetical protein [Nocardiopsis composta]